MKEFESFYIGELRLFTSEQTPHGWIPCDGRTLPICEFSALFSLIGTTFGGDGVTDFALPDLRDRVPVHHSDTAPIGSVSGNSSLSLSIEQMPEHTHRANACSRGNVSYPDDQIWSTPGGDLLMYAGSASADTQLAESAIEQTGKSEPIDCRGPRIALAWAICAIGIYPIRGDY